MKTSFGRKQLGLAAACTLALGIASGAAHAQGFPGLSAPDTREVWTEGAKTQIWKNGYGECWHSAFGPPPGYNECNPAPVAQYVPPPAPYVAPPAPRVAPVQYVAPAPAPVVAPAPLPPKKDRN